MPIMYTNWGQRKFAARYTLGQRWGDI